MPAASETTYGLAAASDPGIQLAFQRAFLADDQRLDSRRQGLTFVI
jgi:hypothetical protein